MVLRQLPAATARSAAVISNCTNFSASANEVVDTSGPTAGPAPNAGGAPGGRSPGFCPAGFCPWPRNAVAAPSTPRDVNAMNCLRDFAMYPPQGIVAVAGTSLSRQPQWVQVEFRHNLWPAWEHP